jgi:DNA-binding CsgD family transcriptional regulator
MESLKSVEQAAETLALSPWTVRAYIRQGKDQARSDRSADPD